MGGSAKIPGGQFDPPPPRITKQRPADDLSGHAPRRGHEYDICRMPYEHMPIQTVTYAQGMCTPEMRAQQPRFGCRHKCRVSSGPFNTVGNLRLMKRGVSQWSAGRRSMGCGERVRGVLWDVQTGGAGPKGPAAGPRHEMLCRNSLWVPDVRRCPFRLDRQPEAPEHRRHLGNRCSRACAREEGRRCIRGSGCAVRRGQSPSPPVD